jgi:hypothetical protein
MAGMLRVVGRDSMLSSQAPGSEKSLPPLDNVASVGSHPIIRVKNDNLAGVTRVQLLAQRHADLLISDSSGMEMAGAEVDALVLFSRVYGVHDPSDKPSSRCVSRIYWASGFSNADRRCIDGIMVG